MKWHTLKLICEHNESSENSQKLKVAVQKRVENGGILLESMSDGFVAGIGLAHLLFDLMYCYFSVLKDNDKSGQIANALAEYILEHPDECESLIQRFQLDLDDYYHAFFPKEKLARHLMLRMLMIKHI
jgi:hypothetical protein